MVVLPSLSRRGFDVGGSARAIARNSRLDDLRPGCVVTTIYPEGRDIWDAGLPSGAMIIPRLGWCAPYAGGFGRHDAIRRATAGSAYSSEAPAVPIEFAIRDCQLKRKRSSRPGLAKNEPMAPPRRVVSRDAATLDTGGCCVPVAPGSLKELTAPRSAMLLAQPKAQAMALVEGGLETTVRKS
jgi:hypothetical protein